MATDAGGGPDAGWSPLHGPLNARLASGEDAPAIAAIYNQGIEDRTATFETDFRSAGDVSLWFDAVHPIVVVEAGPGGQVVGFASTSTYRPRRAYAGIAEFSVYVARGFRRQGVGRLAMEALARAAADAGFWKLVSRVMVNNEASRGLLASVGFREVGTYRRHARLEGTWRDVVVVELLIGEAADDAADQRSVPGGEAVDAQAGGSAPVTTREPSRPRTSAPDTSLGNRSGRRPA